MEIIEQLEGKEANDFFEDLLAHRGGYTLSHDTTFNHRGLNAFHLALQG
jgi:hypothetical protein